MKKVLVVNTVPYSVNGISSVIENYFRFMDSCKVQMDFVVNEFIEPRYRDLFESKKAKIFILKRKKVFSYILKLRKIIRENHYDVVHIHGNSRTTILDLFGAWLGKCKFRIVHSHNTSCSHFIIHRIFKIPFDLLCTGRMACGQEAGKWLFGNKSFEILNNALDLKLYQFNAEMRKEIRNKLGLLNGDLLIGHVGCFNDAKNQSFSIQLLKEIQRIRPNSFLMLVGDGPRKKEMEQLVKKLDLTRHVFFMGVRDDVTSLMSAMDVFLFPSKWEGLPVVILEAQLMGLPCVMSNNIPEKVNIAEGNVRLSLTDSIEKWGTCILQVFENSTGRQKRLVTVDDYDIQKQVKKLESFYYCNSKA